MISHKRLRQIRLARGLTQDELVAAMGGMVTKSALSLYEKGTSQPRPGVLLQMARALGVDSRALAAPSDLAVEFVAFRRKSGMSAGVEATITSRISFDLEKRVLLEQMLRPGGHADFPLQTFPVNRLEDAEEAAINVRDWMGLGRDAIGNVTETLEAHGMHVFEVETSEKFDGISAVVKNGDGRILGTGIAVRAGMCGERQRLTKAHEAGHLFVNLGQELRDPKVSEAVAFRFGGAFLIPAETLRAEVGRRRSALNLAELLSIKKRYGMSIAALLMRMKDLEILSAATVAECFIAISRNGWRTSEPEPCEPETSQWLRQNALRAHAEGLLTTREAEEMVGEKIGNEFPALTRLKALRAMPVAERNKILQGETDMIADRFNDDLAKPPKDRTLTAFTALDGVDPLYLGELE